MGLRQFLTDEWRQLASVQRSDRPWEMPVAAALAGGLPIFISACGFRPSHGNLRRKHSFELTTADHRLSAVLVS
jgi:hypothetical protein